MAVILLSISTFYKLNSDGTEPNENYFSKEKQEIEERIIEIKKHEENMEKLRKERLLEIKEYKERLERSKKEIKSNTIPNSQAPNSNPTKNSKEIKKRLEEERKRLENLEIEKANKPKEIDKNNKQMETLKFEQKAKIENFLKQSLVVTSNEEMHLKKTYEVSCIITDFNNKTQIDKTIERERRSKIIDDSIKTSKIMSMKLIGVNFDIQELNESKQALNFVDNQTDWKWKVRPLESGKQILEIEGYAYIDIEGEKTPIKINVYKKEIDVNIGFVNAIQLTLKKNWEWIFGIVPFLWFLLNRYKKKKLEMQPIIE